MVNSFIKILAQFRPDVEVVYTFFHPLARPAPTSPPTSPNSCSASPMFMSATPGMDGAAWHNQAKAMAFTAAYRQYSTCLPTAKGQLAEEGVLAETRAGNAMFPPHELGYPNAKHAPMILERVGALPTYGMGVHMLTGMLYLEGRLREGLRPDGQYPTPEQVATALDGLSIIGPCGITSMINHQSTASAWPSGRCISGRMACGSWKISHRAGLYAVCAAVDDGR